MCIRDSVPEGPHTPLDGCDGRRTCVTTRQGVRRPATLRHGERPVRRNRATNGPLVRHCRSAYGSTRAAPCCGVVGMWPRPMRLRNTQYVHAWYASTNGSVHSATHDMIISVYGVELAFSIVRL